MSELDTAVLPVRAVGVDDEVARMTRRELIKRIIASGAVASGALYLYGGLAGCARGPGRAAGAVERLHLPQRQWRSSGASMCCRRKRSP